MEHNGYVFLLVPLFFGVSIILDLLSKIQPSM